MIVEINFDCLSKDGQFAYLTGMTDPRDALRNCLLCQDRFAATQTQHVPRPVVWFSGKASILIASQAPGMRAHLSAKPFNDPSGKRLRQWLGMGEDVFYDQDKIAIAPMAFCFPGYDRNGSDLPPPPICALTWRKQVLQFLPDIKLTLVIGGYAMRYHLGQKIPVTQAVFEAREGIGNQMVLPHPSWRNTAWLKKNAWFEEEVVPRLQRRVNEVLYD